ncbi:hypothetical protein HG535_0G04850 [Zygotorulaspora mrakii]|uniref:ER membrane protein complex subunit 4 n=1 Tax=Zygotorulaspora mrakii TaxID=42260 RepID=A0A7H9BA54_ZYGMR|nr:uncharacterized protein HG535_0G04850 [Zygotorulaspora mrakii]QLG74602.1 hypothetical protein HG535_0G04850 [Zygotorulaspora mrakii]
MKPEAHQWALNLVDNKHISSMKIVSSKTLPLPEGFTPLQKNAEPIGIHKQQVTPEEKSQQIGRLQLQKAWGIAFQPAKAVPMNIFMSYMSGTSLQIIPIMTALMLLSGPIKAIFGVRNVFRPVMGNPLIEGQIYMAMLVFVVCQGALMYIGIRKLNSMGLIPNTRSDWLAWETRIDYNKGLKSFTI